LVLSEQGKRAVIELFPANVEKSSAVQEAKGFSKTTFHFKSWSWYKETFPIKSSFLYCVAFKVVYIPLLEVAMAMTMATKMSLEWRDKRVSLFNSTNRWYCNWWPLRGSHPFGMFDEQIYAHRLNLTSSEVAMLPMNRLVWKITIVL